MDLVSLSVGEDPLSERNITVGTDGLNQGDRSYDSVRHALWFRVRQSSNRRPGVAP
jgi:hypothetical protein